MISKHDIRRLIQDESGATAMEYGLVAGLLVVVIGGLILGCLGAAAMVKYLLL